MPVTIELSTYIPADPDVVWERIRTSRLLAHVTHPLIHFRPLDPDGFPAVWRKGDYQASMRLFGVIPMGGQTIGIRYPEPPDARTRVLHDQGYGTAARIWDHYILIAPEGGGTRYTDRVTVDAGWRTPFVAAFARAFYAHRQCRLRRLARKGFEALEE